MCRMRWTCSNCCRKGDFLASPAVRLLPSCLIVDRDPGPVVVPANVVGHQELARHLSSLFVEHKAGIPTLVRPLQADLLRERLRYALEDCGVVVHELGVVLRSRYARRYVPALFHQLLGVDEGVALRGEVDGFVVLVLGRLGLPPLEQALEPREAHAIGGRGADDECVALADQQHRLQSRFPSLLYDILGLIDDDEVHSGATNVVVVLQRPEVDGPAPWCPADSRSTGRGLAAAQILSSERFLSRMIETLPFSEGVNSSTISSKTSRQRL